MLALALALCTATFFLISPPPGQTYPGAMAWRDGSFLRPLMDLLSLNGLLATVRGVEIKDVAFHLAAAAGLAVLGVAMLRTPGGQRRWGAVPAAAYAQALLAGWVLLSLLSSLWAGDAELARGQAALYALNLAWAVSVAATLRRRDVAGMLFGVVAISALGAALCVWYYYERNPHHRPGVPIGNPNSLAAALVPAILICVAALAAGTWQSVRSQRVVLTRSVLGAIVALAPLVWCFVLTGGRGAMVALAGGLAVMLWCVAGRRTRWVMAGAFLVAMGIGGIWLLHTAGAEMAMARGATVRFRLYAWRYASDLWGEHRIIGNGAGCYPRLAGQYAVMDRALDPAAFMGELVEHAHSELFEVLAEIGLVGGVTFVGGFVATFFAAAELFFCKAAAPAGCYADAIVGSVAALLLDSMFGPALRLPGVTAIFYTLVGVLWAVASAGPEQIAPPESPTAAPLTRRLTGTLIGVLCLAATGGATWLALRNCTGVRLEAIAWTSVRPAVEPTVEQTRNALDAIRRAEVRLLDPVRKTAARKLALDLNMRLAQQALEACAAATAPLEDARERAIRLTSEAYAEALALRQSVPALELTDASAAQAAEWLNALMQAARPAEAARWAWSAEQAWRRQRKRTPYDVRTLLMLTRYPASLAERVGLLRDALRFLDTIPSLEPPRTQAEADERQLLSAWLSVLVGLAQSPGFDQALGAFVTASGPITPETDLDALVASMAPEAYRLEAAWRGLRGEYTAAAVAAGRASELYQPMRLRFPVLESRALAEEAEYVLRGSPTQAEGAVVLMRRAIDRMPVIQSQQYDELLRPFRERLALYLRVARQEAAARKVENLLDGDPQAVRDGLARGYVELAVPFIRRPGAERLSVRGWLEAAVRLSPTHPSAWSWLAWLDAETGDAEAVWATLRAAAKAGVSKERLALIRRSLAKEFPALGGALKGD